jgi:hypothetical protein
MGCIAPASFTHTRVRTSLAGGGGAGVGNQRFRARKAGLIATLPAEIWCLAAGASGFSQVMNGEAKKTVAPN